MFLGIVPGAAEAVSGGRRCFERTKTKVWRWDADANGSRDRIEVEVQELEFDCGDSFLPGPVFACAVGHWMAGLSGGRRLSVSP